MQLPQIPLKLPQFRRKFLILILVVLTTLLVSGVGVTYVYTLRQKVSDLQTQSGSTKKELEDTKKELEILKNEDQRKVNQELKEEIKNIKTTYSSAVTVYEDLLKLKEFASKTQSLDKLFTNALVFLAKENYSSASATLSELSKGIADEQTKLAAAKPKIPENVPEQNSPPRSGYSRQKVSTNSGTFLVDIVAADLGSTKVIVDTASDRTCASNCPVMSLASYVARNGAYAGVNGSYFCPATYPSCVGKENSFDSLLMNKNKVYFNSDNNVYSSVPAVIFGGSYIRFVSASSEWGRDTGIDSMIANRPMLVQGGNIASGGGGEAKEGVRGNRSFVANRGNTVYIGVVHGATVAESAKVMKALGMENALNLDDGGSTALWSGGYKVGPGRDLPNAILFVGR